MELQNVRGVSPLSRALGLGVTRLVRRHEDPLATRVWRVGCVERALARVAWVRSLTRGSVWRAEGKQAPQAPLCETLRFQGNRHVSPLSRALGLGVTRLVRRHEDPHTNL